MRIRVEPPNRNQGAMNMQRTTTAIAGMLLGLIFFVFGLNGFLRLFPQPPMEGRAGEFIGGLLAAGYVFPLLFGIYTVAGAALLAGRFVPLALILLAPVIVNIVALHAFLAPSGLPLAMFVLGLEAFLAWSYRESFGPLLRANGEVTRAASSPARRTSVGQQAL